MLETTTQESISKKMLFKVKQEDSIYTIRKHKTRNGLEKSTTYPTLKQKFTNCHKILISKPTNINSMIKENMMLQNYTKMQWEKIHHVKLYQLSKEKRQLAEEEIKRTVLQSQCRL